MAIRQVGTDRRPWELQRAVVVLGEFDGFHLGHRQLAHDAFEVADRLGRPLVAVVLDDSSTSKRLTSVDERCWALLASGAASSLAVTVDSIDGQASVDMVADTVLGRLAPTAVVMACPPDQHAASRYPSLRAALAGRGIEVLEVPRWTDPDGEVITSARIRDALGRGQIAHANDWLGRTFTLAGTVVHGSGLGHTIGFPTANLSLPDDQLVPMRGVYAAHVDLQDGSRHRGAVNIGVRPTVEHDGNLLVEAHLLDFDADIYDQPIEVRFRRWLRHEQRFEGVDQLVEQLGKDVLHTRVVLRS